MAERLAGRPLTGAFAMALAVGFNVPYALLAARYDYPDILRRPAHEALSAFAAGGAELIWIWYGFGLTALALVPLAIALALSPARVARAPGLSVGAAIVGAAAGLTQAIGLFRWVFVIPILARAHADPSATASAQAAAERTFDVLNAYGGVAIGEHVGQMLTALFVALIAALQAREGRRLTAGLGTATALCILIGTGEGLALALGASGDVFSWFTIAGFAGFAAWLLTTGVSLLRGH